MLRATVVCDDGKTLALVYRALESAFDLQEGHGRLKNLLDTKEETPPRMILNVLVAQGTMVAEVQLHLRGIKEIANRDHRYYEVLRATALQALLKAEDGFDDGGAGSSEHRNPLTMPEVSAEDGGIQSGGCDPGRADM